MNFLSFIPLFSCVAYSVLLAIIIKELNKPANKALGLFLLASCIWSLFLFFASLGSSLSSGYLMLWNQLIFIAVIFTFGSYYHFARAYTNKPIGILSYCGYASILLALAIFFNGYVIKGFSFLNGLLSYGVEPRLLMMMAIILPVITITMLIFIEKYHELKDSIERNKIAYLTVGLGISAVFALAILSIQGVAYLPVDNLGVLINALIVVLVMRKRKLPDLGIIFSRTLAYSLLGLVVVVIFAGGIYLEIRYAPFMPFYAILATTIFLLASMHIFMRRLRHVFEEKIDQMFRPYTYAHRRALIELSSKIANTIDLDGVANEILYTMGSILRINRADLLLKNEGNYVAQFTYSPGDVVADSLLELKLDSSIAIWLAKEDRPLRVADISNIPEMQPLLAEESNLPNWSLLLPVKGRESMIGILALGIRQNGDVLYTQDIELAEVVARQSGIVIENAQLYTHARQKANTDELTGLFNHRHFHERLFEEVSRSSRFGDVFSLLMIDLDCFKSYNDIYGHLHGDKILKKVGEIIRNNVRIVDVAARYGGDEFSAILPKTSIDAALRIADRLRLAMESEFNNDRVSITCSVGVASWPTDGIMKEALIHAADSALYHAKKMGRNLIFTASKLATLNIADNSMAQENNNIILDTIYALAATVDAKDHYTYGHSKKVSKYACDIATELGYSEEKIKIVRIAGLLHDIGKIGVSDEILGKNTDLNDNEWKPIHAHPSMGVSILRHIDSIKECLPGVLYHHERYDGMGYPQRLKGENIPLDARILAVADSYDAMTSNRSYRDNSWTSWRAIEELIRCSGTQFDPRIVKVFIKLLGKKPGKNSRFVYTHNNL